jgi:nucleotide-binding universal stress UspA family protein
MISKILVPLDGTELAEAALAYAQVIANRSGAGLALVRVVRATSGTGESRHAMLEGMLAEAHAQLARVAESLVQSGLDVETSVAYDGRAADWILEEVDAHGADLVAMATHGRTGSDRLVHGSTAESVVHGSTVPVMLVRSHDASLLAQRFAVSMPTVVVPLDGTPLGESALPFAQDLAETVGAQLRLIEVLQPHGGRDVDDEHAPTLDFRHHGELEAEVASYLEAIGSLVEGESLHVELKCASAMQPSRLLR